MISDKLVPSCIVLDTANVEIRGLKMMCCVPVYDHVSVCVCYNIENVKEQHQGEAERQSIQRERKHP